MMDDISTFNDNNTFYQKCINSISSRWKTPTKTVTDFLSREEMRILVELDTEAIENIEEIAAAISNYDDWTVNLFYSQIAKCNVGKVKHWEEATLNFSFLASRAYVAEYYSFDLFDRLAESPIMTHKLLAMKGCNTETLLKLSDDKTAKVRKAAMIKLGRKALDKMLSDPRCEIREVGVMMAPIGYPKLKEMKDDLSFKVVRHLVKKIDVEELPYILGNRNFQKSENIRSIIEQRLNNLGENND